MNIGLISATHIPEAMPELPAQIRQVFADPAGWRQKGFEFPIRRAGGIGTLCVVRFGSWASSFQSNFSQGFALFNENCSSHHSHATL